jgi:transposase
MSYLRGPDRSQAQLLPPSLEDYVPAEAPVRFIEAFVEQVDYQQLGFAHAQPAPTGRPPYHPGDLLALYLYGYLNRIRSSRRLEAEAGRNMELIWLLRGLRPDFKTIADFRKNNRENFKGLFKQFNLWCRKLDLFGAELVAIDGSKFKALNNSRRHYTQEELKESIGRIEKRIEDYLSQLDSEDRDAEGVAPAPSPSQLKEKIEQLRATKSDYGQMLEGLHKSKQNELSLTDPDSRKMKGAQGQHFIGYNVQTAVDAKHHLIVAEDVVQCASDRNQLAHMAQQAKEALAVEHLKVVADKGYHEADQLEACEQAAIETFVPAPGTTSGKGKGGKEIFPKERFTYNDKTDTYHCPGGHSLERHCLNTSRGKQRVIYANISACKQCPLKDQCTTGEFREIARRVNEVVVERAAVRAKANPQILTQRKEIVEHPYGSMRLWGHDVFLLRGLQKVRAEFSLSALVYNLRRVINLVSLERLRAVMKSASMVPAMG